MLTLFDKLADELNTQIGHEFGAHIQYLAMASYFESRNLENLAHFFYAQAEEEKDHGLKIVRHINYAGGKAIIPAIPEPKYSFALIYSEFQFQLLHRIGPIDGLR
jgi:ferritin